MGAMDGNRSQNLIGGTVDHCGPMCTRKVRGTSEAAGTGQACPVVSCYWDIKKSSLGTRLPVNLGRTRRERASRNDSLHHSVLLRTPRGSSGGSSWG